MAKPQQHQGLNQELQGGMTSTGNIIRGAWVFGLIPEGKDCACWTVQGIDALYDKVAATWAPHGQLASRLPSELAERHARIYAAAVARARAEGWNPELGEED